MTQFFASSTKVVLITLHLNQKLFRSFKNTSSCDCLWLTTFHSSIVYYDCV